MLLTDGLSLSEGEVAEAVPGLGSEGVEEVEEDALAVSARQELVRILDVDKVGSWQHIIIIIIVSPVTEDVLRVDPPSVRLNSLLPPPSSSFSSLGTCISSSPLRNLEEETQ